VEYEIGMRDDSDAGARVNFARFRPGQTQGHYESFFQRANHPTRPLAFWIRYTSFSPQGRPADAVGELWAVWFDGETRRHVAVKREVPIARCSFDPAAFSVAVDDAVLGPAALSGAASSGGHEIAWQLSYHGSEPPLFFLPRALYAAKLPRAKSLVGLPLAAYAGTISVDGDRHEICDWVGSQNHNWGSRHTDEYAWGQVAGFDSHPGSFLEVATARVKIGPLHTPQMTLIALRHRGEEILLNRLLQSIRARATRHDFHWTFAGEDGRVRIEGTLRAPRQAFVGLRYANPPGGEKHCLNSKIARCELRLTDKRSAASETLIAAHRAAFEILTDDREHGIEIRA
jgi:hypothetical protein